MKSSLLKGLASGPLAAKVRVMHDKFKDSPYYKVETFLVVGSIFVGLVAAYLNERNRQATIQELTSQFRLVNVYVAREELTAGSAVNPSVIKKTQVLAANVTANMVDEETLSAVLDKHLLVELKAGDPLLLTAIDGPQKNSLTTKIPPGKRLFMLQIADKVAGNGWVKPNDHVDVIAHMDLPGRGATTFTLLQDVTLVSVGKATVWDGGASSAGSEIGFYVTPEELELLKFSQEKGDFSLALRNPNDIASKDVSIRDYGKTGMDMKRFLDHSIISRASGGTDIPVTVQGKK